MANQPSIGRLFIAFIKLGTTAFGGPSMVAYIRKLAVERFGWLSAADFAEGVSFCQIIPGATAMQTAAYVGLRVHGAMGAAAAYLGFGLPAFGLMLLFSYLYTANGSVPFVAGLFSGLQAIVVAVVLNAAWSFGKTTIQGWWHIVIAVAAAGAFIANLHPIFVIVLAAASGRLLLPRSESSTPVNPTPRPYPGKLLGLILTAVVGGYVGLFFLARDLFELGLLMTRVDLMAFGGGFASVPLMYHEVVESYAWIDSATFMNGIVMGQVTPGPIVITATFIGYLQAGWAGALIATISVFLPSFLLVIGLWPVFHRLTALKYFHPVMRGVLCSFVGLLASVALRFIFQVPWDVVRLLLAAGALLALLRKVDILWVVLTGAVLSAVLIR
jgi:chromate transporter